MSRSPPLSTHAATCLPPPRARMSWVGWMGRMLRVIETRRQLASMDDRMLADIGITRAEALLEANRPPWDLASVKHEYRR